MINHRTLARRAATTMALICFGLLTNVADAQSAEEIQAALDAAYSRYKGLQEGANADYIPALARVDPDLYGIALVTTDGKVYTAGDIASEVSIQSISKVFTVSRRGSDNGSSAYPGSPGPL